MDGEVGEKGRGRWVAGADCDELDGVVCVWLFADVVDCEDGAEPMAAAPRPLLDVRFFALDCCNDVTRGSFRLWGVVLCPDVGDAQTCI